MRKNINKYIKNRRILVGIIPEELSMLCNLSVEEYGDIEGYHDELYTVVPLKTVACLCDYLDITLNDLYSCPNDPVLLPKKYVEHKMYDSNISVADLSCFIGIEDFYVENIMEDIVNIGSWVMDPVILLANKIEIDLGSILMSYSVYSKQKINTE